MTGNIDRGRRRTKSSVGNWWAKALLRPGTFKNVVALGKIVVRLVWIIYSVIAFFNRE
jgi:hypothetical protein